MTVDCANCGSAHAYPWQCRYDLHGHEDFGKSSCAWCDERTPMNAPRDADKFGNLYCSRECLAEGYAELFKRVANGDEVRPESGGVGE